VRKKRSALPFVCGRRADVLDADGSAADRVDC
jgi:hypothetical protein